MDGATKFVRGDAIAAIIMIVVNVLGGFAVGVGQKHMDIIQALQTYTLLTVGEGLVTQIPALLISTATGLMVTKNGSKESLGWELMSQVLSRPKAVAITAGVFGIMFVVPGMPKFPLLVAASIDVSVAYMLTQSEKAVERAAKIKAAQPQEKPAVPESMTDLIGVDPLALEIGYGLIALADPKQLAAFAASLDRFAATPEFANYLRDQYALPESYIPQRDAQKFLEGEVEALKKVLKSK